MVSKEAHESTHLLNQQLGHMSKKGLQLVIHYKSLPGLKYLNLCKHYISIAYGDEVKGYKLWDLTSHKMIINKYLEE